MIEPFRSDDALLAEIAATPRAANRLDLWWLAQSGYLIQHDQIRILIDPYLSDSLTKKYASTDKPHVRISRRVIDPAKLSEVDFIASTHMHTDHADAQTIRAVANATWEHGRKMPSIIVAKANLFSLVERVQVEGLPVTWNSLVEGQEVYEDGVSFTAIAAAHPELSRDEAGNPLCIGLVISSGGFRICHSGDSLVYNGLAESVAALGPIDLALLPINGKVGNMDGTAAARLAKAINAKLVVPCHYDLFAFNTADPNDLFVPECERIGQSYRVLRLGERLTLHGGSSGSRQ